MPKRTSKSGSELFIVDNSDDWKVIAYVVEADNIGKLRVIDQRNICG